MLETVKILPPDETVLCEAAICREESRDIPVMIPGTSWRKAKRTVVIGPDGSRDLGWTHLDCER